MLHVLSSLSNKNHTNPLSLTSLSQLNLQTMGLRPLSNRDTIQPWMGHWPSSTPTLESERRSRVVGRGIDPEFCDYGLEPYKEFSFFNLLGLLLSTMKLLGVLCYVLHFSKRKRSPTTHLSDKWKKRSGSAAKFRPCVQWRTATKK